MCFETLERSELGSVIFFAFVDGEYACLENLQLIFFDSGGFRP